MQPIVDLLDFHFQPSMIFGLIGVIMLAAIAVITFWGFDE